MTSLLLIVFIHTHIVSYSCIQSSLEKWENNSRNVAKSWCLSFWRISPQSNWERTWFREFHSSWFFARINFRERLFYWIDFRERSLELIFAKDYFIEFIYNFIIHLSTDKFSRGFIFARIDYREDLFSRIVIAVFREDLFSRIVEPQIFREDLISRIFLIREIKSSRKLILAKINPREN